MKKGKRKEKKNLVKQNLQKVIQEKTSEAEVRWLKQRCHEAEASHTEMKHSVKEMGVRLKVSVFPNCEWCNEFNFLWESWSSETSFMCTDAR